MRHRATAPTFLLVLAVLIAGLVTSPAGAAGAATADPPTADDGRLITSEGATTPEQDKQLREFWTAERRAAATPVEGAQQAPSVTVAPPDNMEPAAPARELFPPVEYRGIKVDPTPPVTVEGAVASPPGQPGTDPVPWPGKPGNPAPQNQMGALYFVDAGGMTRVCSATAVNSPTRNVVLTAAACLAAPGEGNVNAPINTRFVYTQRWMPLDKQPEEQVFTYYQALFPREWLTATGSDKHYYNVGALVMNTSPDGRHVVDVTGGHGLVTYQDPAQEVASFEWRHTPGDLKLYYCKGTTAVAQFDGSTVKNRIIRCSYPDQPTTGWQGGPWLSDYNTTTGYGYLTGLTGSGAEIVEANGQTQRIKSSSYFGWVMESLYKSVANAGANDLWIPMGQRSDQTTGFTVQNLSPTLSTTVRVDFLDDDDVQSSATYTIPARGTTPPLIDDGPAGTTAVHVARTSATGVRIAAAVNHLVASRKLSSSTASNGGANQVLAPLLMQDNFGTTTKLTVQNTEGRRVDATVTYTSADGDLQPIRVGLPPHTSRVLDQAYGDLPQVFAARISATGNVAVVVTEESAGEQLEYEGLPTGTSPSTRLALPIVVANNFGGFTGIAVQNSSGKDALVTLRYLPNKAEPIRDASGNVVPGQPPICQFANDTPTPYTIPERIRPGGGASILQNRRVDVPPGGNPVYFDQQFNRTGQGCRYVGGAYLEADTPVVAIINQAGAGASAIPAVNPLYATANADLPLVQTNNSRTLTGIQIMNLGLSAIDTTIDFGDNFAEAAGSPTRCPGDLIDRTVNVRNDNSETVLVGDHPQANPRPTCRYVGAATVAGPLGSKIAVVVNQANNDGSSDPLSSYLAPSGPPAG